MSNATANWQSYKVGSKITIADGRTFEIVEVESRVTDKGYRSRLFHLVGPNGERLTKTSRGLSLWATGSAGDVEAEAAEAHETQATPAAHFAAEAGNGKTLAEVLAEAVRDTGLLGGLASNVSLDRDEVAAIVDERLAAVVPQRIEVVRLDGTTQDVGVQHTHFDALLRIVACRLNSWLVGPAGSGKTSAAKFVAESLGLRYLAISVGQQTTQSQLLGYYDATGKYVSTPLRDAYENGGVFLIDEADAASPATLVVINSILANGHAAFPDGVVEKHPDCVLVAAANTIGQGADSQYVGRQQADAATLDRFVFLPWESDPRIEAVACGVPFECFSEAPAPKARTFLSADGAEERCAAYVRRVVAIRNSIGKLGKGVRLLVGNRANISGCKLIRAGWSVEDTLEAVVWKGCDKDTRAKVEANC